MPEMKVRVMDTYTLAVCNRHATRLRQNRRVPSAFLDTLDPDGVHVIVFHMDHVNWEGTPGVRCRIFCKQKGQEEPTAVWIDLRHEDFNALPTIEQEAAE